MRVQSIVVPPAACFILAAGTLLWASSLLSSLFGYRSPLLLAPTLPGVASGVRSTQRVVLVSSFQIELSAITGIAMAGVAPLASGPWAVLHCGRLAT